MGGLDYEKVVDGGVCCVPDNGYQTCERMLAFSQGLDMRKRKRRTNDTRPTESEAADVESLVQVVSSDFDFTEDIGVAFGEAWR